MPPAAFFNETHVEPVRSMLEAGGTYRGIAAQYGCDHQTVRHFVRRHLPEWYERRRGQHTNPAFAGLKILILDIETIAGTARLWHGRQRFVNPDMVTEDTRLFCFAAKWLGEDGIEFRSVEADGRVDMVTRVHELLSEADGVVTYNGDNFDLPHLGLEFLRNGMTPPAPFKSVDLIKTIRRKFRFMSNRLTRVSAALGIGEKIAHEGWELWEKCEAHDKAAWKKMREYNCQDVLLTEQLYLRVLPWLEGHPSWANFYGDVRCTNCGSEELEERGFYYAKTRVYPRYRCAGCGKWQRARRSERNTEVTETALS